MESVDAAAGRLTTDLSAEYLHYACRGMAGGMVRDMLVALDRSDATGVLDALDLLGRHGDTSGMDCALGIVLALRHAETGSPSRAPAVIVSRLPRGRRRATKPPWKFAFAFPAEVGSLDGLERCTVATNRDKMRHRL